MSETAKSLRHVIAELYDATVENAQVRIIGIIDPMVFKYIYWRSRVLGSVEAQKEKLL